MIVPLSTVRKNLPRPRKRDFSWMLLVLGLALLLYPTIADRINQAKDRSLVEAFEAHALPKSEADQWAKAVEAYNASLSESTFFSEYDPFVINGVGTEGETQSGSPSQPKPGAPLDTAGAAVYSFLKTGEMLFSIHIPKIDLIMPVYYGTEAEMLLKGGGLIKNTSYPGGNGGNAVISAHRGTHDKDLFLHVDRLLPGDVIYIVDQTQKMKYVVTGQAVVSPYDTALIQRLADKDLITLVTCTPLGLNYQRLLIFAERVPMTKAEEESIGIARMP